MPIYEYRCTSCHHQFDLLQKISADPIKKCPHCFEDTAQRLVSAAGFQLKGSGWYATDFKSKGKAENKTESNTESGDKGDKPLEKATADSSVSSKPKTGDE